MKKSALTLPNKASIEGLAYMYEEKLRVRDEEIAILREQVNVLKDKIFGKKTEKLHPEVVSQQISLFDFDEAENNLEPESTDETESDANPAQPKKKRGARKPLPGWLSREQMVHDLTAEEKVCECGCEKACIGDERSEVLERIPARAYVVEHIRLKYVCKNPECSAVLEEDAKAVAIAKPPARMIPKSLAGHTLLAHVLTAKFADWLPFHRVEKQLQRENLGIRRQTMCRWAMKVAEVLKPLWDML